MPLSIHQSSVGVFTVTLNSLLVILDKALVHAEQAKFDPAVYMTRRLRPNMLTFARQVMIACDSAKNGCARLAGVDAPVFEDNETTIPELKTRIEKTLAFLAGIDKAALESSGEREIVFPVGPNKARMRGDNYLLHWALPNHYFHVTTAYALLREAGVDIGKKDYMGNVPGFVFI